MTTGMLEHVNVTVSDAKQTAAMLQNLFDWKVRWEGPSMDGDGYTVHVGTDDGYLAVYSWDRTVDVPIARHTQRGGMNHIGVVVDDLQVAESRVIAAGYRPHAHYDYEPGKRFYFADNDGIEYEVVSYAAA